MDLRRLLNVAYATLMESLTDEQRAEWHDELESGPGADRQQAKAKKPAGRNVSALMRIASSMPRG